MKPSIPFGALLCSCLLFTATGLHAQTPSATPKEEEVAIQLPGNSINDILDFYEMLTGKRLIRDANLAGPNLTIVVPGKLPKSDAIALLESDLLLNGYTLVPVDQTTMKVIGTSRSPLGENIPLYADLASLPATEQEVSYFMLLKYISTKDAMTAFQGYVTSRPQGKIIAVPNSNAILITDNTPLIRRLIALQQMIDVPSANVVTELIPLTRASAEKVADMINKLLDKQKERAKEDAGSNPSGGGNDQGAQSPSENPGSTGGSTSHMMSVAPFETQLLADPRSNGILVEATESNMLFIKKIISALDQPVAFDTPLQWHLRFVSAGEVLPVLQTFLAEGDDTDKQSTSPTSSQNGNSSNNSNIGSTGGSSGGSGSGDTGEKPDKLKDPDSDTGPLAVNVGKARILADRSANEIIIVGPPDVRSKAASVLQMLDQKPKQIYLAVVIGQLTLGNSLNFGIQYPSSIPISLNVTGRANSNNQNGNTTTITGTSGNVATVDTTANSTSADQIVNSAFQLASTAGSSFFPALSLFGVFANSINLNVEALQSTNHFKVISRPVIYTANNKKAVISSGEQVPVPETSLTSAIGNSINGSSIASSIEYKDVDLKLEVIPLINSKNEVTLTIAQQNDNIDQNVVISNNSVPEISTQELTTTVTVPNRQTVVLGGLITEQTTTTHSGLPLLSSIPVVGYLFGSKEKAVTRRELIIMIQPFIVDTPEEEQEANNIEKSNSSLNGELYQEPVPVKRATLLAPMGQPFSKGTKNEPLPSY